ncbi:MAG: DNA repair protein RecN [Lachnospiraceae bacterium]|nr:DNA repair protein RecN [Lachnospiraceae bacterium]
MLLHLQVKNLALLKGIELDFTPGLSVLTGETGAGKSILIGSVNLALGCRADADLIRSGQEEAFIELVFSVDRPELAEALKALDVNPEDGMVVITRRIREGRSTGRINGETVTSRRMREVSSLLIDLHGQHEHQSLLDEANHLHVLDLYGGSVLRAAAQAYSEAYKTYRKKKEAVKAFGEDPEAAAERLRYLEYEIREIGQARIRKGEEDALVSERKKITEAAMLREQLSVIREALSGDTEGAVSAAVRASQVLSKSDPGYAGLQQSLQDLESLQQEIRAQAAEQLDALPADDARLQEIEDRLDVIRRLKHRYGGSEERILETLETLKKQQQDLSEFEGRREEAVLELKRDQKELVLKARALHDVRVQEAARFDRAMEASLADMNFLEVHFRTEVVETNRYRADGADEVRFLISTNPGEMLKPLTKVASGGELSRIMLAIKAEIAGLDGIDTLVFDEIDSGISGKTAYAVARKMRKISRAHQVICISHLPQIAAAADSHYGIRKHADAGETVTEIRRLQEEQHIGELARLLGAEEGFGAAYENAKEMDLLMKKDREGEQT